MVCPPDSSLKFRCAKCRWCSSVKSDAISFPHCCPKCGSTEIRLEKSKSMLDALKSKLGL